MSLRILSSAGVSAADPVIDVGGGASPLAQALLDRGFRDVTVLDVSEKGMQYARRRLGPTAGQVRWLAADVLAWKPERRYRAWHDRAVFHILTARSSGGTTCVPSTLLPARARSPCSAASPLTARSSARACPWPATAPPSSHASLGSQWRLISLDRQEHVTPSGLVQPFTWSPCGSRPDTRPWQLRAGLHWLLRER
jgi:hypothetical protein